MNQEYIKTVLLTPPDHLSQARAHHLPIAHMAYRFSDDGNLLRANLSNTQQNDLMFINGDSWNQTGDIRIICQQMLRECNARRFRGIILDFSSTPTSKTMNLIRLLDEQTRKNRLGLYLPEAYHQYSKTAKIIISSAISGGSLPNRLASVMKRYGSNRVVLSIERSAEAFSLPSMNGMGKSLTQDELQEKIKTLSPAIFFSNDLYAHYFTYMSRDGSAHFILYDDVGSIQKKLTLAKNHSINECFLLYPQVDDVLSQIFN